MLCTIMPMHHEDLETLWRKVTGSWTARRQVSHDDEDNVHFLTFINLNWRFESSTRGITIRGEELIVKEHACLYLSFYPPQGGSARYDGDVHMQDSRHIHTDWTKTGSPLRPGSMIDPAFIKKYAEYIHQHSPLRRSTLREYFKLF